MTVSGREPYQPGECKQQREQTQHAGSGRSHLGRRARCAPADLFARCVTLCCRNRLPGPALEPWAHLPAHEHSSSQPIWRCLAVVHLHSLSLLNFLPLLSSFLLPFASHQFISTHILLYCCRICCLNCGAQTLTTAPRHAFLFQQFPLTSQSRPDTHDCLLTLLLPIVLPTPNGLTIEKAPGAAYSSSALFCQFNELFGQ